MRVLIEYVLRLSALPFLVGIAGFVIFVSVEVLYQLSDLIVRHRVGIERLFLLLYYYTPYFVTMGIPVGVLLAIFWTISKLHEGRELMALQVHGVSQKSLIVPFLVLGAVLSVGAYLLSDSIVPRSNSKAEEVLAQFVLKKPQVFVVENVLTKLGENQYLYVEKYDEKREIFLNIVLFRYGEEEEIITARRVEKRGNKWYLCDGKFYSVDKEGFLKLDVKFNEMEFDLKEDLETLVRVGKTPREMTGKELKRRIQMLKRVGIDPAPWIVELQGRHANALAPMIIVLVGIPISLLLNFRSKSWGVIFTFILVVLYQGSGAWLSAMGKERLLTPSLAPWIPNIVFSGIGGILFLILDTSSAQRIREKFGRFFIVLLFLLSSQLFGAEIKAISDEVFKTQSRLVLQGNVILTQEDTTVTADRVVLDLSEEGKVRLLTAEGRVTYRKEDVLLSCEKLVLSFKEKKALLYRVRGTKELTVSDEKKRIFISGEEMEMTEEKTLAELATFTTCSLEKPHYKVKARKIEIQENEYLLAQDVVFYILDIPVFYQPVFFSSLSEREQPFSLAAQFGRDGWMVESVYRVYYQSGKLTFSTKLSQSGETRRIFLLEHEGKGFTASLNREEGLGEGSVSVDVKTADGLRVFFSQKDLERVYLLSKTQSVSGGRVTISLQKKDLGGKDSYELPSLSLKNVALRTNLGTLSVQDVQYLGEFKEGVYSGKGTASSSFLSKPFLFFDSFKSSLNTSFQLQSIDSSASYRLLLDNVLDVKNVKLGRYFSLDDKLYGGLFFSEEKFGYRLGNLTTSTLSIPLKPFSFNLSHKLFLTVGENVDPFTQNRLENELLMRAMYDSGNFKVSIESSYDFLKDTLSDPILRTSQHFSLGRWKHTVETVTRFDLDEPRGSQTTWSFTQRWNALTNKFSITLSCAEPYVQTVEDTLRIYGRDFFFMRDPNITAHLRFNVTTMELESLKVEGSFFKDEAKNVLKFDATPKSIEFSYSLSQSDPEIEVSANFEKEVEWKLNRMTFALKKDLHCLGARFSLSFGKGFTLEAFSISFYIRDFPDKVLNFGSGETVGLSLF